MGVLQDLADALAKDTIEASQRLDDDKLITEVAKQLSATSSTMEEAYMTSIRVRLSEQRARDYLSQRLAQAAGATEAPTTEAPDADA